MMTLKPSNDANPQQAHPTVDAAPTQLFTLHDMRKRSGFSGALAAELCQTSYQSIRNWENGAKIPNVIHLLELLEVYGYTIDQLDLTPFYLKVNRSISKREKNELIENEEKCEALNRLDAMRRQYTPGAP